ncbi:MAG: terminase large subunit domain-containing protein [Candidatus Nanohaloarchaea archaeon]
MGRQVGKDFTISVLSLWQAITQVNYRQLIVSNSQRASDKLYERILGFVARSDQLSGSVQESNREKIVFKNKSEIYPLPSTGRIRGFTEIDRIYCNEVAHDFGDNVVDNVLEPMLATTDGHLTLMSTPLGTTGKLYEAYNSVIFAKMQLPTRENQYISEEFLEERKAATSDMTYQAEYLAEFIDEQDTWIKSRDIDKAVEEYNCQKIEPEKHRDYYAGIDWGRVRDSSVITVVSKDRSGQLMAEHIKSFKDTPAREVISYLSYLNEKFELEVAVSEYVGLGIEPTERIEEETDIDVERFETTVDKKLEAYEQLRNTFEQEEIMIPNHRKLVTELKMLRYESTRHGNIKIHHPEGGKDDHTDALCLAVRAAKQDRSRDRAMLLFPE